MTWDSLCASLLFLSVVCGLYAGAAGQVDSDNVLTLEEQMYLVIQASWRCDSSIQDKLNHSDDGDCPPEWDGFVCWPSAKPGSVVTLPCPAYIFDFNHEGHVVRWCSDNGTWLIASQKNRTMVDYSQCEKVMPEGKEMEMYRRLSTIYTVGYSTSIISDIFALLLLAYFKRLHCTRNYIHMQLFVSFVLRGGSILVRDAILDPKITGGLEPGLGIRMNTTLLVLPESPTLLQLMECKTCMFMFLYFLATNYFWMLVEGLYLHSLIFLTFYSRRQCFLWFFTLIGWVLPLVFVFSWAVVRATIADSRCWDMETDNNYEWIYEGPILFSVVVNFLLLLNIVRVIMIKLNQNNAGHQQASQRHRKLIKSTLALMMLFGTHYVVGFGYEHFRTTMLWKIGMYFEIFFSSFMGFFVSLIYCFCNGEVQTEIKKAWTRWQLAHGSDFDGRLGRCGAGNLLPSFTSAASSVRSSLAAVGGSRRNEHRHHTSITDASSRISSQIVTDEAVQELPKYTK